MHYLELFECGGRIVKGVNTTCDVKQGEMKKQMSKFNFIANEDGMVPILRSDGRPGKPIKSKFSFQPPVDARDIKGNPTMPQPEQFKKFPDRYSK